MGSNSDKVLVKIERYSGFVNYPVTGDEKGYVPVRGSGEGAVVFTGVEFATRTPFGAASGYVV